MKLTLLLSLLSLSTVAMAKPQKAAPKIGNIVFLGDSITQGGSYLRGPVASYRYQVFKNFVDNNVPYKPMGTTLTASKNVNVSHLTPDYRGIPFPNISEAAASARTYQYSAHPSKGLFRPDPGTVFPIKNRGPVNIKLGLVNPYTKTQNTFYDGTALKTYQGDTYASLYGDRTVNTLCILIGINDLYDARQNLDEIANNVLEIINTYRQHNPKIRVHVFEVLPTAANNGTGSKHKNNYPPYNEHLRKVVPQWSTKTSKVTLHDITAGFYAEDGSMVDGPAGAHPNAQGELIIAGNIARELNIGQRNLGLTVCADQKLTVQTAPQNAELAPFEKENIDTSWNQNGAELIINSTRPYAGDYRFKRPSDAKEFTFSADVKIEEGESNANYLSIWCGNGSNQVGQLFIGESGIYWNANKILLYGNKGENKIFTKDYANIRIVWMQDNNGKSGFCVWLNGQLIGEYLQGDSNIALTSRYANTILFGDTGSQYAVKAAIKNVSLDSTKAYAPQQR